MNKKQAKKRIKKLVKEIQYHRFLYHIKDKQEISDSALDLLKHELAQLEKKYPDLILPHSPTQRVGGKPLDKFEKVEHSQPMLSLNDVFDFDELNDWLKRIEKINKQAGRTGFFCEPKIDGLAVALIYKKGVFKQGATRGNGKIGEDVTANLKTIASIPLELNKPISCEIRGEVYLDKQSFKTINQRRKKQGLKPYANPRNTAAGSIRQLDPKKTAKRDLSFLAWQLLYDKIKTQDQEYDFLQEIGFKPVEGKLCQDLNQVNDFYKKLDKKRNDLPYQIDGLVVSVNSNDIFDKLGVVGKAPRGAIAWKFPGQEAVTVVKDIKVQIGRTGALTPVAILKPVNLGGTTISRATLHNQDEIDRLDVRINDNVVVSRAGDVIPDIIKVLKRMRTGKEKKFYMPKKCPVCGSKVKKQGVLYYCNDPKCFARAKRQLNHFISRQAFDIEGLGPRIIEQLLNKNLIKDRVDLFELKIGDLIFLEGFAHKSAQNLIKAIDRSRNITLARFIYALGIRYVGEETAFLLAQKIAQANLKIIDLQNKKTDWFEKIENIGPVAANSIYKWFNTSRNQSLLNDLLKQVKIKYPKNKSKKSNIKNKIFVLTGALNSMSRDQAKEKIRSLGGDVSSSVSKNTDFVVVGQKPGSKLDQAKKLGVKIIKEAEFLKKL